MHSGRLCLLCPQEMLAKSPRGASVSDEKTKNLDLAIAQIEKQYGKGSIMRRGNGDVLVPVNVIPTHCARPLACAWLPMPSRAVQPVGDKRDCPTNARLA